MNFRFYAKGSLKRRNCEGQLIAPHSRGFKDAAEIERLQRTAGRCRARSCSLSRRQKTLAVNIPYRGSKGPLHLLIDSAGIKAEGEGEWHARKHGSAKRRLWRKIHLGVDEQTLGIRAVEITGSSVGGAPMQPELLGQIPR